MKFAAFAPVSIGNFIVGFDLLGAALADVSGEPFGDVVRIESADRFAIVVEGAYASRLPADPDDNIVSDCVAAYRQRLADRGLTERFPFRLRLEKRLPIGSGLGSSASSIVAALFALDAWHDGALGRDELLRLAGIMEGRISGGVHYDNVAPSLLGGLRLLLPDTEPRSTAIPLPAQWRFVLHYPGISVSTRAARAILPSAFPLADVVRFGQYLAAFIDAAHRGDEEAMCRALRDDLIVPHRAGLVPGYAAAEQASHDAGALAFGLSGSGPTVFAIGHDADVPAIITAIENAFPEHPDRFTRVCRVDDVGARCL